MATEDWETTVLIYPDETYTEFDEVNDRFLRRGSIDLNISLDGPVFCRQIDTVEYKDSCRYKFWMVQDEVVLRISFVNDTETDCYKSVHVSIQSPLPTSFPQNARHKWPEWIEAKALVILHEECVSYSVCMFVQEHALDFFPTAYKDDNHYLIQLSRGQNCTYTCSTIVATLSHSNPLSFERHDVDGTISQQLSRDEAKHIFPLLVLCREWLPVHCKICLDASVPAKDSARITCGHAFCRECISEYCRHKVRDVRQYKTNPFLCPTCRQDMLIVGCVKQFLSSQEMATVREWVLDVKNPPCYSLPVCLKKTCQGKLRRIAVNDDIVYCDECEGQWCERCLQRAPKDKEHDTKENPCKLGSVVEFCKRYLAANESSRRRCEERFPWIKVYAQSRMNDNEAYQYIKSNGQVCPGCKTGIERTEGCFHISCPCGTHFCYLCGEELFAPFYGTHHCWERQDEFLPYE